LFTIARNKVADTYRGRRRAAEAPWDSREVMLTCVLKGRRPTTPWTQVFRRERAAAFALAMSHQSPLDRELLELRWLCDLMPLKIVEVLELREDPNTISKRIHRATRRLRAELLKCDVFAGRGRGT
jgi:DNA-directed RNA polymerase specialized sigma24 family protein